MTIHHLGYTLTTPWAFDARDAICYHWQIYKREPLTSLRSEATFADAESALRDAREFVERELTCPTQPTTQE